MLKLTDWELAWDGRADYREMLPINPDQLPCSWFQWRYRYQITTGFAQRDDVAAAQVLVGLMGGPASALTVGQFNGKEFEHKVILDVVDIVKWELTTKFTVASLAYQFGTFGFAFYTWYSSRQDLITYLPGVGNNLGLDKANATILRARELDKFHPVSRVITSTSGESYPWEDEDVTGTPLGTLGSQGVIVTQDAENGIGFPQEVQFYGWFIGPLYELSLPAGSVIDIKFHNIGVPVGDRWAYIETRSSPTSYGILKPSVSQDDFLDYDTNDRHMKNAFFASAFGGAADTVGRSEVYYPESDTSLLRQVSAFNDFTSVMDTYANSIWTNSDDSGEEQIHFPQMDDDLLVSKNTVFGEAPDVVKNEEGITSLFFHYPLSNKLIEQSALYRSIIMGVAIKTSDNFYSVPVENGKFTLSFNEAGTEYTISNVSGNTDKIIDTVWILNSSFVAGKSYTFHVTTDGWATWKRCFISNDDKSRNIYYVQSSDEADTWERDTANVENEEAFNSRDIMLHAQEISGIQENPNDEPLLIAEKESFPIGLKWRDTNLIQLFSNKKTEENNNLMARRLHNIDVYVSKYSQVSDKEERMNLYSSTSMFGGQIYPSLHQEVLDKPNIKRLGFLDFRELVTVNAGTEWEIDTQYYECLQENCPGPLSFYSYENSGTGNNDVDDLDKKYDSIIYQCSSCGIQYDIIELTKRELIPERPISAVKNPNGGVRVFYNVSPKDYVLSTNYINVTTQQEYDYISEIEGVQIQLAESIEESSWIIYIDENGLVELVADPESALSSVVSINVVGNKMLWNSFFKFELRYSGTKDKVFVFPQSYIASKYSQDGQSFIYDNQFNRAMINIGHSNPVCRYNRFSRNVDMFSFYDGGLYYTEFPETLLTHFFDDKFDRGLLPMSSNTLSAANGINSDVRTYLIKGTITKSYQELINKFPSKYFLGNYELVALEGRGGNTIQAYRYHDVAGNDLNTTISFYEYDDNDNVIYRDNNFTEINMTEATEDNNVEEQIVQCSQDNFGKYRVNYYDNDREINVEANQSYDNIYQGFTIAFGELKTGWVTILFNGTTQPKDLLLKGPAKDTIENVVITDEHLIYREIKIIITQDDGQYIAEVPSLVNILSNEGYYWKPNKKNM